jgi:hypothetical protein
MVMWSIKSIVGFTFRGDCWRRKKLTIVFFGVTPKISFKGLFFEALLEML